MSPGRISNRIKSNNKWNRGGRENNKSEERQMLKDEQIVKYIVQNT